LPRSPLVRQSTRLRLCRNAMAVCWPAAENAMYVALLALPSLNIIDAVWLCLTVSWCFMWFSFQFPTGGSSVLPYSSAFWVAFRSGSYWERWESRREEPVINTNPLAQ
jgi:hypothetical protein